MSDIYYDKRGKGHFTKGGAESANQSYTDEEIRARDEMRKNLRHTADATRQQAQSARQQADAAERSAQVQAEQLRLAEQQAFEQRAHNERVEAIALQEAAEAQAQREFTKDVQWLKDSDAEGRLDYLLGKRRDQTIEALAEFVLTQSSLVESPLAPRHAGELKTAMAQFYEANRACVEASAEHARLAAEVRKCEEGLPLGGSLRISGWGGSLFCGIGGIALSIVTVKLLITGVKDLANNKDGGDWFGSIFAFLMILLFGALPALLLSLSPLVIATQKREGRKLAPQLAQGQNRLADLMGRRTQKLETARSLYPEWCTETISKLEQALGTAISNGSMAEALKKQLSQVEAQFPPLLRIDWKAIDGADLEKRLRLMVRDDLRSAVGSKATPQLFIYQLITTGENQWRGNLEESLVLMTEVAADSVGLHG